MTDETIVRNLFATLHRNGYEPVQAEEALTRIIAAKDKAERERDEARTLADDVAADSRKNYQSACQLHNKLESLTAALRKASAAQAASRAANGLPARAVTRPRGACWR